MSANGHRGELSLDAAGEALVLRYTVNSLCALEEKTGKTIGDLTANLASLSALRAVLWAGLLHSQPGKTLEEAGALIDKIGPTEAIKAISEALTRAFPPAEAMARPH